MGSLRTLALIKQPSHVCVYHYNDKENEVANGIITLALIKQQSHVCVYHYNDKVANGIITLALIILSLLRMTSTCKYDEQKKHEREHFHTVKHAFE